MSNIDRIYLDYAATTPMDLRVLQAMLPYYKETFGNASAFHSFGKKIAADLDHSRGVFAGLLGVQSSEIYFTSSATESNNTILQGVARANRYKGNHIIISSVEHPSVFRACQNLENEGFEITKLKVDARGFVEPDELKKSIRKDTILVSVVFANNEIGTTQPVEEIGNICRENDILFHSDAVQLFGKQPLNPKRLSIDFLSASGHKINGPAGAALLFCRQGVEINPLMLGGNQEQGLRPSTENMAAIAGFAKAAEIAFAEEPARQNLYKKWKSKIVKSLTDKITAMYVNGDTESGLANILSISFKNVDAELLLMMLDREGIALSSGSACASGSMELSPTLQACGIAPSFIKGTIRVSMGRFTTEAEIDQLITVLPEIVQKARNIS